MRYLAVLFATLVLAGCSTAPVTRSEPPVVSPTQVLAPELQKSSIDPVVQFLLTAAATDFHTHRPPDPVRFRDVRIGHVMTPGGEAQYMLCGQFLPAQEGGKAEWMPFATIKTSDYEQWIGAQAAGFCQGSAVIWDNVGDLSSSLQSRLILEKISGIVGKQLDLNVRDVDVDVPLSKQKKPADDLDVVEIMMNVEEAFGIEIKNEEVGSLEEISRDITIKKLADIVSKKTSLK